MTKKETDGEWAIDAIFRAAYGVRESLKSSRSMVGLYAAILTYEEELKSRGWIWQPEEEEKVVKVNA